MYTPCEICALRPKFPPIFLLALQIHLSVSENTSDLFVKKVGFFPKFQISVYRSLCAEGAYLPPGGRWPALAGRKRNSEDNTGFIEMLRLANMLPICKP